MTRGKLRGHEILLVKGDDVWLYADTMTPTIGNPRDCGHCSLPDTPEGHDGCLGTLPGVMNACCGYGTPGDAYVQYPDSRLGGQDAVDHIETLTGEKS